MAAPNLGESNRLHPAPRPPIPLWSRRWVGFPSAPPPIGRDCDIAAVRALLLQPGRRVVTVTGPGGIGKTRLALAVAESLTPEFPDGGAFVPLAAINDPALVLPSIARMLDLREVRGGSPRQTLIAALRDRRLLLVLDNVEHLAGPAAVDDLAALIEACPALRLLVTSRTPLHLHDEQLFATPALALPPSAPATDPTALADFGAIALFADRARAVRQDFALTAENAAPVVEICRRLDGLPLAIELAAAWARILPPADLLARLEPRLPMLRGGAADQPPRLRTMRDAIAWSYDRLSDDERWVFRRLSVFVGGFTLEAAERVAGGGGLEAGEAPSNVTPASRLPPPALSETLDLIASLIDQSLLVQSASDGADTRFAMLETIREFGLEQLMASGEAPAIAARHATWCAHFAESVWCSGGMSRRGGLSALETEHPNFRAALSWLLAQGETTAALHLAGILAEFWLRHGHLAEGQAWLERTLAADAGVPTARAEALVGLNMLLWQRDDFARAEQLLDEAEAAARGAGDAGILAYARLHQGYVALMRGDFDLAVSRGEESLTTCATIPQGFNCHGALWLAAIASLARGDDTRAAELYDRLLASAVAGGDEISIVNGHGGLAILAERRGALGEALAEIAEAAAVCHGSGDHYWSASHVIEVAAGIAITLGHAEPGVRFFAAARARRTAVGATPAFFLANERPSHEQALTLARETLGEQRFAAAWAAGSALSLEAAVAEVAALARDVNAPTAPDPDDTIATLTTRERQILPLLLEGRSDREIAAALFISQRTASNHVGAILRKLKVATRAEAAVRAYRAGLG